MKLEKETKESDIPSSLKVTSYEESQGRVTFIFRVVWVSADGKQCLQMYYESTNEKLRDSCLLESLESWVLNGSAKSGN